MKKKLFILAICVIIILFTLSFINSFNPFEGKTEYPLQLVDIDDDSQYMLVKEFNGYEVVTDTELIKENASVFRFYNFGALYGTTPDGSIFLYKDGVRIDCIWFDGMYTIMKEFGTLKFQKVNELQYQLLLGSEIVEQDEHYSILCNNQGEKPYYYCFAHGEDLHSVETVSLVASDSNYDEIPQPQKTGDDIVEFSANYPTYAGDETAHWYFRLFDCKLSQHYLNVKAMRGNRIICTDSNYMGLKIIVCDMFDNDAYYTEITGAFSKEAGRLFLLSAEFTADGNIYTEYIGNDSQVHKSTFEIEQ